MDLDGLVVIAVAGLWIAYLVPHHLRHRQQLLEARADDRFSERLRVLRVAEGTRAEAAPGRSTATATEQRVLLHPGRRREDGSMHRPHAAADRVSADAARRSSAARAARAASLARRAAAARRRALLSAVLLVAALAAWGGLALGGLGLLAAATPSVLLLAVLGLGRRAVLAGRRADAAWAAGQGTAASSAPARPAARPAAARPAAPPAAARPARTSPASSVVGRAVHPSEAVTEVIIPAGGLVPAQADGPAAGAAPATPARVAPSLRVDVSGESLAPVAAEADPMVDSGVGTWVPVPVPPPAYTLKPTARPQEPAPLPVQAPAATVPPASARVASDSSVEEPRPTTGGLALDAILARRRAAGE